MNHVLNSLKTICDNLYRQIGVFSIEYRNNCLDGRDNNTYIRCLCESDKFVNYCNHKGLKPTKESINELVTRYSIIIDGNLFVSIIDTDNIKKIKGVVNNGKIIK